MEPARTLPAPAPVALVGRTIGLVRAPADAVTLMTLVRLCTQAGLGVRVVAPGEPLGAATAGTERVVLAWSAAMAGGPDVSAIRAATGGAGGDRLLVLRLDETPLPERLAGRASPLVEACLRALAEAPVPSALAAIEHRLATLRRVARIGALLVLGGLSAAGVIVAFGVPDPVEGVGAQVRLLMLVCALMPPVTGVFVMLWAWLDRWSLARRVASYLVDRELEAR